MPTLRQSLIYVGTFFVFVSCSKLNSTNGSNNCEPTCVSPSVIKSTEQGFGIGTEQTVLHTSWGNGITNLQAPQYQSGTTTWEAGSGTAFYGDATSGAGTAFSAGLPVNKYFFAVFNLGNITAAEAGWPVKNFTQWDPGAPYVSWDNGKKISKQLSSANVNGVANKLSALQASGVKWGAYFNSDNYSVATAQNKAGATIRYTYAFPIAPLATAVRPFKTLYGNNAYLSFKANIQVTKYKGPDTNSTTDPIGYVNSNVYFKDVQNNRFFVFIGRIFGFGNKFESESVGKLSSTEMFVASYLGNNTTYCSKNTGSSNSYKPASYLDAAMPEMQHFSYKISRTQFIAGITAMNAWLTLNDSAATHYSTDPNDYILSSVNIGLEGNRLNISNDAEERAAKRLEMAYTGNFLTLSTVYTP